MSNALNFLEVFCSTFFKTYYLHFRHFSFLKNCQDRDFQSCVSIPVTSYVSVCLSRQVDLLAWLPTTLTGRLTVVSISNCYSSIKILVRVSTVSGRPEDWFIYRLLFVCCCNTLFSQMISQIWEFLFVLKLFQI